MQSKRGGMTAADVMSVEPACATPSMSLRELAQMFQEHEISGAPVVDAEGRVVGVVSRTDLMRELTQGTLEAPPAYFFEALGEQGSEPDFGGIDADSLPRVEEFMTEDPATVGQPTPIGDVARRMAEGGIHRVIVVDDERFPVGIVTSLDLLRHWPG